MRARQTQIYDALGWKVPVMAHIPLIHGPDGSKLSKRHGALGVDAYRAMGYLPAALRNYLVRLGWSHGDQEIFSTEEMIALSICRRSAARRRASTSPSSKISTAITCARPAATTCWPRSRQALPHIAGGEALAAEADADAAAQNSWPRCRPEGARQDADRIARLARASSGPTGRWRSRTRPRRC